MKAKNISLLQIHVAVLLFGLSGLFGKLIALPAIIIVLGRVFFASIFLLLLLVYLKRNIKLQQQRHYFYLAIMGVILAIHWITFFLSIQVSTVAIGLLTFSTFPVFVTFLEPYFFKENIRVADIIVALITFVGVLLVIPEFQLDNNLTQGVLWGITSGFTYAILSMLNRKFVSEYSGLVIAFYEQVTATILLIPFFLLQQPLVQINDIVLLILLGILFTGVSHSLFISGLKNIKTQTAGIISTLEPVYGVIFAVLLLQEIPSIREVLGGIIIIGTVVYSSIDSREPSP
ncbi:DMT family transporter [Sporomusa sp.]|uniref:DMT family transporter n=1 Tax=Sporomusa sp. TaxID=2078658 RepID=UPI002C6FFF01|nr:DMT family transporter [Sporomusa sp.]HWR05825.1 DMT family transporter [Sporomusa sp.]